MALGATMFVPSAHAALDGKSFSSPRGSDNLEKVARVSGETRYDTSIEAAKHLVKDGVTSSTVYVTGGEAFPDSLAVTPLADCTDAPVLLTPKTGLNANVVKYLKDSQPTKIVVVGGPLSVSSDFENELAVALGFMKKDAEGVYDKVTNGDRLKIERVAGETRYETAYKLAAETLVECGIVNDTALANAKENLQRAELAEQEHADATRAYENARKKYAKAQSELNKANERLNALNAEITELSRGLKPVAGMAAKVVERDAAVDAAGRANETLKATLAAQEVFNTMMATYNRDGYTTLDLNSTLQEYYDRADNAGKAKISKAIDASDTALGDKLNEALDATKTKIATETAAANAASQNIAKLNSEIVELGKQNKENQAILDKIDPIQKKVDELVELIGKDATVGNEDTLTYKAKAEEENLGKQQDRLSEATAARPKPLEIETLAGKVADAYDNVVKAPASAKAPIFLADGNTSNNALVAGPAAANQNGVQLLTDGAKLDAQDWTKKYVDAAKAQIVPVGAAASKAVPADLNDKATIKFDSADDFQVARDVAAKYFNTKGANVAIASGEQFADAVIASSFISQYDGPLMLTKKADLTEPTFKYLAYTLESEGADPYKVRVFGGPIWIKNSLFDQIAEAASL